jgi:hypothetical protein
MSSKVSRLISLLAFLIVLSELMQTEDRFTAVKDALKSLNKMDLDKLIYAVGPFRAQRMYPLKKSDSSPRPILDLRQERESPPPACRKCSAFALQSNPFPQSSTRSREADVHYCKLSLMHLTCSLIRKPCS